MKSTTNRNLCVHALALSLILGCSYQFPISVAASQSKEHSTGNQSKEDEARRIGIDAYIFGYPLVTMELTRRVMTNADKSTGRGAPMGQFAHMRNYPSSSDKAVTAPNADTLYSCAWLDLSEEPYVLSVADADGRYYLLPMLDGWTTVFADPGTRVTGTQAQKFVITGPNWTHKIPADMTQYKSATNMVWILGRTYCSGAPEDYDKVHAFQDKLSLVPLSAYGKEYAPPEGKVDPNVDIKTPVRDQVNSMDAVAYFKLLSKLMGDNPPTKSDSAIVGQMSRIGIVPGKEFDPEHLDPAALAALKEVPKAAQEKIMAYKASAGKVENGWSYLRKTGIYGSDYLDRALVTAVGLGANRPADAVYPIADTDGEGKPLDGSKSYTMHFEKNQIPPVEAFWSVTMYDDNYFFVPNALNRYDLASHSPLKYNADGSLDLYFQSKWPGRDKQANWLQTPEGKFNLILRMYWPKPEVIEAKYTAPPVRCVE